MNPGAGPPPEAPVGSQRGGIVDAGLVAQAVSERRLSKLSLALARLAVGVAFLAAWQWLPQINALHGAKFLNPLFISSPSKVAQEVVYMITGSHGAPVLWSYLRTTLEATAIGGLAGVIVGALLGLLLSSYQSLSDIAHPYMVALNSIPRVALIPVVILIAGPTVGATSLSAALVVVFIVFFNAYQGGRSLPQSMIENSALFGARRWQIMWRVRGRYCAVWTVATLPNAISFSLIAVVTTEILSGVPGLGYLILQGLTNLDSALIFACVVVLSIVGVALFLVLDKVTTRLMHGVNLYGGQSQH